VIAELLEAIASLTTVMEEETDVLTARGRRPDLAGLTAVKLRLVGRMEASTAQMARACPDWLGALDDDMRHQLATATATLLEAARRNAEVLARRIELATEMMAAVAAEARRLTGARNATYAANGRLLRSDQPAPISLNTRL
jgi:flagellar biosynthesis/type III secretory pathway chaperone